MMIPSPWGRGRHALRPQRDPDRCRDRGIAVITECTKFALERLGKLLDRKKEDEEEKPK